jgi:xanthine dehydrogenase accessory factor
MRGDPVDSWSVIEQAAELAKRGEEFALATVVWRQGPSSGHQGSRAIITSSGEVRGWIGGACAEPVVIREAQGAIRDREPRLLLLGMPGHFGSVPDGMTFIPISCQSEGAMEVYIEPVLATPHLVVVGRSPMARTLCDLAIALGWRSDLIDGADFSADDVDASAVVVVATQGHGDEDAIGQAAVAAPAYLGLVASRKRGEAVLGYLEDRGVPRELLDRVHVPVGLDLGHTSHREIAVAVLAELVQLRVAGALAPQRAAAPLPELPATVIDAVCGMTVNADPSSNPLERKGVTYYFCSVGCRSAFEKDPTAYLPKEARC